MKNFYIFITAILLTTSIWAQSPEKMSYQAVVRDADNNLVTSQQVGMRISILQGSIYGASSYVETQSTTSNANGLISVNIGSGTVLNGDFSLIDWSADSYFIKTETDPTGGTNYTITGTSQLMSVPYALYAKTSGSSNEATTIAAGLMSITDKIKLDGIVAGAEVNVQSNWDQTTITSDDYIKNKPTVDGSETKVTAGTNVTITGIGTTAEPYVVNGASHYIGELYLGGIVFYIYNNGQNGLVASLNDVDGGIGVAWSDVTDVEIGATAKSFHDGAANTDAIITQQTATSAAQLCRNLGVDWYLPANWELNLLFNAAFEVNKILENDENSSTNGLNAEFVSPNYGRYWSSTECNNVNTWHFNFNYGSASYNGKVDIFKVRAIRAF